jgi:hypothetical protein
MVGSLRNRERQTLEQVDAALASLDGGQDAARATLTSLRDSMKRRLER